MEVSCLGSKRLSGVIDTAARWASGGEPVRFVDSMSHAGRKSGMVVEHSTRRSYILFTGE